jgi:predicted metal-dependent phosphoesterase TrpH
LQLKIDLHVHTNCSYDSLIKPEELVLYAKRCGLDGVAITDHDRLNGAMRISRETEFLIIPGIEVTSSEGHILGLNVRETVPKGLSADETVDKIHDAGGLAVACHPTAFFKGSLGNRTSSRFDAVEVINASAFPFGRPAKKAQLLASRLGLPQVAGSDAHYGPEIGSAYTKVDAVPRAEGIMKAITKGLCEPFGKAIPLAVRLKREVLVLKRRF